MARTYDQAAPKVEALRGVINRRQWRAPAVGIIDAMRRSGVLLKRSFGINVSDLQANPTKWEDLTGYLQLQRDNAIAELRGGNYDAAYEIADDAIRFLSELEKGALLASR